MDQLPSDEAFTIFLATTGRDRMTGDERRLYDFHYRFRERTVAEEIAAYLADRNHTRKRK